MPPQEGSDFDLHLVQAIRGLKELRQDLAADIFVSYCASDDKQKTEGAITPAKVLQDMSKFGYKRLAVVKLLKKQYG